MENLTVYQIVKRYLEENGFTGLYNTELDNCGCELDHLFPCCEFPIDCQAGYKCECPASCGDHDYHVSPNKPKKKNSKKNKKESEK